MIERTARVGDVDLALAEAGSGGRPLLLVHGFTGAKEDFTDFLDRFAALGWWAVAPDLRGHGGSSKPADEAAYDWGIFADDLCGLVDELGWERFTLLGHSMGGMVAQLVAHRRRDHLDGLVLMDTSHRGLSGLDPEVLAMGAAIATGEGMEALKAAQEALGEGAPLGTPANERVRRERPGYVEFGDQKLLTSSPAMYASMIVKFPERADQLPALRALRVPTLVVVGEQDAPFLAPSHRMAEAIPDAQLAVLPDAGHSPQFENPEAWWEAVSGFLATLP